MRSVSGSIEVRWEEGERQRLHEKVDDQTAVGVPVGGAVEVGAAVGRVGDEYEPAGNAAGLEVAGVGEGVSEGVYILERAGFRVCGCVSSGRKN